MLRCCVRRHLSSSVTIVLWLNGACVLVQKLLLRIWEPVPSLPLLSTLNLTTVTLSTTNTIFLNLKSINRLQQIQNCLARTVVKAPKSSLVTSSDLCTGSRSTNALNINSFHYYLQSSHNQPTWLPTVNILISVQSSGRTRSSSVVTLARPSVSSSLQIINRSFKYISPHLWNQLPSSFRQPHCVHSPPGSPHPTHITSSQSSPSFSPSVTPSTFHSRLKTHLFHKSFPP